VSRKNVPFQLNTFYTNYKKLAPSKTKLATTPVSTLKDLTTGDAALEKRFTPVLVAETATTEPIVGVGTGPFTPFWAMAAADRLAKPTDGGLNLKTEYTFFWKGNRENFSNLGTWQGRRDHIVPGMCHR
jgi:hypothetical protein